MESHVLSRVIAFRKHPWPLLFGLSVALSLLGCDSGDEHAAPAPSATPTEATGPPPAAPAQLPGSPGERPGAPNLLPAPSPGGGPTGAAAPDMTDASLDTASGPSRSTAPPTGAVAQDDGHDLLETEPRSVSAELVERLIEERRQPLRIDHLLSRGEVRQVTGYTSRLDEAPLEGQPASEEYNGMRLAAADSYGFGLQVWRYADPDRADSQYDRMRETYVVTGTTRVAGDNAFRAAFGGIRELVFTSRQRNTVVALSCDETVCPDESVLQELAQRVRQRL